MDLSDSAQMTPHDKAPDSASTESATLVGAERQRNVNEETRIVAESHRREAERFRTLAEEAREPVEVGGVERGDAGSELEAHAVQAVVVARRDDHVGPLLACAPRRLQPDPEGAADHDQRLPGEILATAHAAHPRVVGGH